MYTLCYKAYFIYVFKDSKKGLGRPSIKPVGNKLF